MMKRIIAWRRSSSSDNGYVSTTSYEMFMNALNTLDLTKFLYKRKSCLGYGPHYAQDNSKEYFYFRVDAKSKEEFLHKLYALKDNGSITKYYLIID